MKSEPYNKIVDPEVVQGVAFDNQTGEFVVTKEWMIERNPLETVIHQGWDHGDMRIDAQLSQAFSLARDYAARQFTRSEAEILIRKIVPTTANQNLTHLLDQAYARSSLPQWVIKDQSLYQVARHCFHRLEPYVCVGDEDNAWWVWTGSYWETNNAEVVIARSVKIIIEAMMRNRAPTIQAELAEWISDEANFSRLMAAIKRQVEPIRVATEMAGANVLHFGNGVFEVDKRVFREPRQEDGVVNPPRMTVNYALDKQIGQWLNFIEKICHGNESLMLFLQYLCGYLLAAPTNFLNGIYVLYCVNGNGGSLFVRILKKLLGQYFGILPSAFLAANCHDNLDLSHLVNKRLLLLGDVEFSNPFNVTRLQALATGIPMTGCNQSKGTWQEYTLIGKPLILTTQYPHWAFDRPELNDKAIVVPLEGGTLHPNDYLEMERQLMAESPGILHWMMSGYYRLLDEGDRLEMTEEMFDSLDKYQSYECFENAA